MTLQTAWDLSSWKLDLKADLHGTQADNRVHVGLCNIYRKGPKYPSTWTVWDFLQLFGFLMRVLGRYVKFGYLDPVGHTAINANVYNFYAIIRTGTVESCKCTISYRSLHDPTTPLRTHTSIHVYIYSIYIYAYT